MKKFKTTTYTIITLALVLLILDCYYMVRLYDSISQNIQRDITASLAELDVDELWYRSLNQEKYRNQTIHDIPADGEERIVQGKFGDGGEFVVEEVGEKGDTLELSRHKVDPAYQYVDQIIGEMGLQMHNQIDPILPIKIDPLDSLFTARLSNRGLNFDFVAVEVANSDTVRLRNQKMTDALRGSMESFSVELNSTSGDRYIAYVPSLTKIVLQRMSGVILTSMALIILFVIAFLYMWCFIKRQRNMDEIKDSFVNSMTHELKTPIAVAFSAADSLNRYYDTSTPEHNKEYIGIILNELTKHTAMVEKILSMSMERRKTMRINKEEVDVLPIVQEVCKSQKLKADKDVYFSIDISDDLYIKTDPMHFANIISNLVENAIKYSGESVKIGIFADVSHISVSDNGIGIAQKHLSHIFDLFYRVPLGAQKYESSGYGIGLHYVREICNRLGWRVSVDSSLGKGSKFTLKFTDYEA